MSKGPVSDTWEQGNPYEQYIGRWSRKIAPLFLAWLAQPAGRRWLDVGSGTGALSAAVLERCAPQSLIAVEPSDGFRQVASQTLGSDARVLPGDAVALPLENGDRDVVVSGLVLNFVPDVAKALAEMLRVTAPGGTIAAYVWDYADRMEVIKSFWDAAASLDPAAASLDEGIRFPLCQPAALRAAFEQAGLQEVDTTSLEVIAEFANFEDYWRPFLGGQGPAPAYAMSLSEEMRAELRSRLKASLPVETSGSIRLRARAWGVRGSTRAGA